MTARFALFRRCRKMTMRGHGAISGAVAADLPPPPRNGPAKGRPFNILPGN